jgi:hypothetical protein
MRHTSFSDSACPSCRFNGADLTFMDRPVRPAAKTPYSTTAVAGFVLVRDSGGTIRDLTLPRLIVSLLRS